MLFRSTFAQNVLEFRQTGVSKNTTIEKVHKVLRVLSGSLDSKKDEGAHKNWLKLQYHRSNSSILCRKNVEKLIPSLSFLKAQNQFLYTLFGSICIMKQMDNGFKDSIPVSKLSLPMPKGLACIYIN